MGKIEAANDLLKQEVSSLQKQLGVYDKIVKITGTILDIEHLASRIAFVSLFIRSAEITNHIVNFYISDGLKTVVNIESTANDAKKDLPAANPKKSAQKVVSEPKVKEASKDKPVSDDIIDIGRLDFRVGENFKLC